MLLAVLPSSWIKMEQPVTTGLWKICLRRRTPDFVPFGRRSVTGTFIPSSPTDWNLFNRKRTLFRTSEFLKLNPSKECVFICTGHGKFIARKDLVNCQLILVRFQSIERTFCIMSLDKISCGKLLIRKLISFYFFDTESQLNQLGLKEEFKSFKKWFNWNSFYHINVQDSNCWSN